MKEPSHVRAVSGGVRCHHERASFQLVSHDHNHADALPSERLHDLTVSVTGIATSSTGARALRTDALLDLTSKLRGLPFLAVHRCCVDTM